MGASCRASIMPTESRPVPLEKRLMTVSSAFASEWERIEVKIPKSAIAASFRGYRTTAELPGKLASAVGEFGFVRLGLGYADPPSECGVPAVRRMKLGIKSCRFSSCIMSVAYGGFSVQRAANRIHSSFHSVFPALMQPAALPKGARSRFRDYPRFPATTADYRHAKEKSPAAIVTLASLRVSWASDRLRNSRDSDGSKVLVMMLSIMRPPESGSLHFETI